MSSHFNISKGLSGVSIEVQLSLFSKVKSLSDVTASSLPREWLGSYPNLNLEQMREGQIRAI
jgi:hypothetical protein